MHLSETQINDLVDETLPPAELKSALAHMSECEACRSEVDALRALLQRVAQLPTSIAPARDLRSEMWAKTERKTLWAWRFPLAAAAVLLIVASSAITMLVTRAQPGPVLKVEQPARAPVDLVTLDRRYGDEVRELQRTLQQNRSSLSPETVRILEENLQIIDRAIQEARSAIATDPGSEMLGELLRSAYQRKLDLLKQAARSSAAT